MRRIGLFTLALAMLASLAVAQNAVPNPTTVAFTASADHSALNALDGTPMVAKYEVRVSLATDAATLFMLDIGKPTPDAQGVITVTNAIWFAGLTPKTKFVARVVAMGPTGEGASDPSVPFGNVGPPAKPGAPTPKR